MTKYYELRTTDGVDDHFVADVIVKKNRAETIVCGWPERTSRHVYDLDEVMTWACNVHGIDQHRAFLLDLDTDEVYTPDCHDLVFVA